MLGHGVVEHARSCDVRHHGPEQNNEGPAQAARRVAVTATADVREFVLGAHCGAHSTHEMDCSLDIDIVGLREHVELQVRSDGTGDVAHLPNVNTPRTTGYAVLPHANSGGCLPRRCSRRSLFSRIL